VRVGVVRLVAQLVGLAAWWMALPGLVRPGGLVDGPAGPGAAWRPGGWPCRAWCGLAAWWMALPGLVRPGGLVGHWMCAKMPMHAPRNSASR
jgi:hypothetical protein